MTVHKPCIQSVWFKIWCHLNLINIATHDPTNGSKMLQCLTIWIGFPRRVDNDIISGMQALKRSLFSMVELNESTVYTDLRMRFGYDPNPIVL